MNSALNPEVAPGSGSFSDADFPAPLARDLVSLYESRVVLPASLDARVMEAAGARFEQLRRQRLRIVVRRSAGALAAAAALAIGVFMMVPSGQPPVRDLAIAKRSEISTLGEGSEEMKSALRKDVRRIEASTSGLTGDADSGNKYGALADKPGGSAGESFALRNAQSTGGGGGGTGGESGGELRSAKERDAAGQPSAGEPVKLKAETADEMSRRAATPAKPGSADPAIPGTSAPSTPPGATPPGATPAAATPAADPLAAAPAPATGASDPRAGAPQPSGPGGTGRPPDAGAPRAGAPAVKGPVIGDLNSDLKVNILDALLLAQEIARKATGDAAWLARRDLNADGKVDQKDVDAIALRAVNLGTVHAFFVPEFPRSVGGAL